MPPFLIATLAMLLPSGLTQVDTDPPKGVGVERVTLTPGEQAAFTLATGYDHQLLVATDPAHPAPHAILVSYRVAGGVSVVTVTSRTGYPTTGSVLADPDGNGGFSPMGGIATPGDGTPVERRWPGALGTINIGSFEGGPQGGAARTASPR